MTKEEIKKHKEKIDGMSQIAMAQLWRFAPTGHPYFGRQLFHYFKKQFNKKGGMTSEISKMIGP